jgi:hypothetical protein
MRRINVGCSNAAVEAPEIRRTPARQAGSCARTCAGAFHWVELNYPLQR